MPISDDSCWVDDPDVHDEQNDSGGMTSFNDFLQVAIVSCRP